MTRLSPPISTVLERMRVDALMMDRLRDIDVTLYLSLNPLNWRVRWQSYYGWGFQIELGPLSLLAVR